MKIGIINKHRASITFKRSYSRHLLESLSVTSSQADVISSLVMGDNQIAHSIGWLYSNNCTVTTSIDIDYNIASMSYDVFFKLTVHSANIEEVVTFLSLSG
jgi:hypothetical protein